MHQSRWRQWVGALGTMGAIALGSTFLRADDETPKRDRGDKPAARDEQRPARRDGGRPAPEAGRGRGEQEHYWLGLECMPAPGLIREQLNLPEGQGLVVEATAPESPAAKAGLKKHDILLTANDKPLGEVRQLVELVQASDGKAIAFKLLRAGTETTAEVTPVQGRQPFSRAREQMEVARERMEQLRGQMERAGDPIRMRFFHPGMVLPPGAPTPPAPPLPEGMRVTITRNGSKPAEIEVQQGDETWKGTEEDLSKVPEKFRGPVAQMLGSPAFSGRINLELGGGRGEGHGPDGGAVEQRMNEMSRQDERIREELQEMRSRRGGGRGDGPGARDRGPEDNERGRRGRRGDGPPAPPRGEAPDAPPPPKEPAADAPAKP